MKILLLMIIMIGSISTHAQDTQETNSYLSFRHTDTDKYYTGWMNPRAFISRFYVNHNFNISNALLTHEPSAAEAWNFVGGCAILEGRIATELYMARFPMWGVGFGGALEIPILVRMSQRAGVYSVMGQASIFVDVFLPYDMKLRIFPIYHESTHYGDGYEGDYEKAHISYEFIALELYKKFYESTFYGGVEITYRTSDIDNRHLLARIHVGADYRYPIWKMMDFIIGFNFAMLYDETIKNYPEAEGWHPAFNIAMGLDFETFITSFKYSRQRGFDAATYHTMQNHLGMEFSILF